MVVAAGRLQLERFDRQRREAAHRVDTQAEGAGQRAEDRTQAGARLAISLRNSSVNCSAASTSSPMTA